LPAGEGSDLRTLAIFVVALAAVGLAACGGSDTSTTASSASQETTAQATEAQQSTTTEQAKAKRKIPLFDNHWGDATVTFAADPNGEIAYNLTEGSASAGRVKLRFANTQHVPHNVTIEGPDGETLAATKTIKYGLTSTIVRLKPGVYVIYCSVPGHRKAGMVGHLSVYP
jgi:plastocyanin